MLKISDAKQKKLIYILCIMYACVYLAKLNYGALAVEIIKEMGCTKSAAGLVGSFFFFSYGIGQVVNGFLAKYMNEKYFMTAALFGSALCNLSMCFAPNVGVMKYIWLVNGIVMSPLWCNVVKVQGKYISDKNMPRSLTMVGLSTPVGTAVNYGLCAVIILFANWRVSFYIAAALMTIMAILWYFTLNDVEHSAEGVEAVTDDKGNKADKKNGSPKAKIPAAMLIGLVIMFIAGGFTQYAREGMNAWVPSILYEVYKLPTTLSVALTLFLPLVGALSNFSLVAIERKCKDFLLIGVMFVGLAALVVIILLVCYPLNSAAITLTCFIVISMCCAAIANITTNHIPLYYRDKFDTGSMAGIGQGVCYVGSTLSTFTLGYVADKGGWYNVFLVLGAVIIFACVMCVAAKIFTREHHHRHPRYKFH